MMSFFFPNETKMGLMQFLPKRFQGTNIVAAARATFDGRNYANFWRNFHDCGNPLKMATGVRIHFVTNSTSAKSDSFKVVDFKVLKISDAVNFFV
jgi:hypothetical protein